MFLSLKFLRAASCASSSALAFSSSVDMKSEAPSAYCSRDLRFSSMKSEASVLVTCIVTSGFVPMYETLKASPALRSPMTFIWTSLVICSTISSFEGGGTSLNLFMKAISGFEVSWDLYS